MGQNLTPQASSDQNLDFHHSTTMEQLRVSQILLQQIHNDEKSQYGKLETIEHG